VIGAFLGALLLAAQPRMPASQPASWASHGPDGGIVNQLAVDPTNPLVLYAATDLAGVFKSLDGGASWAPVSGGLPAKVNSLAIDPQRPSTIYISTGGDIAGSHDFVSDDGGLTWTPIASIAGEGIYGPPIVTSLVVDPQSSNTLYAGTTIPGFIAHIPDTGLLSKSTDRGHSWQPLLSIDGEFGGVQQLLVDEGSSQTIFAIANHQLHVSRDAGATWSVLPIDALFVESLAQDSANPSMLIAATGSQGFYRTTNSGVTWNPANDGLSGDEYAAFSVVAADTSTVFASTNGGVLRSDDFGSSWHLQGAEHNIRLTADPATSSTLYACGYPLDPQGYDGVSRSSDSGVTWRPANGGLVAGEVFAVAADPLKPETVFSGAVGRVFKSIDRGRTWEAHELGDFSLVYDVSFDPFDSETIYVASSGGVFESTDGGDQWSPISPGLINYDRSINAVLADPRARGRLFAATQFGKLFRTDDGGAHWIPTGPAESLSGNGLLGFDPHSEVLYFGSGQGLFRSVDSGATWQQTAIHDVVFALEGAPEPLATTYASSSEGLFQSMDSGLTWQPIASLSSGPPTYVFAIAINPVRPSDISVTLNYLGVYRSTDGGEHWLPFNDGLDLDPLASTGVGPLAVSSAGDRLYGAGVGVFVRPIAPSTRVLPPRS